MASVRSLCVYCGSSNTVRPLFLEAAYDFGRILGRSGVELIYGGGRVGLMGRLADGCLAEGGRVVGIIPHHLHSREVAHSGVTELLLVDSMHIRKSMMAERADAFAILPGGLGTLDEMFEILTWRQLGLHDKPIVLADLDGYWGKLDALLQAMTAEGFAPAPHRLFMRVDSIEAILPELAAARQPQRTQATARL